MKQQTKKKLLQVLKIVDIGVLGFIAAFTFLVVTLIIMGDILGTVDAGKLSVLGMILPVALALLILAIVKRKGIFFVMVSLFSELSFFAFLQMSVFPSYYSDGAGFAANVIIMILLNLGITALVYFFCYKKWEWKTLLIANLTPVFVFVISLIYVFNTTMPME